MAMDLSGEWYSLENGDCWLFEDACHRLLASFGESSIALTRYKKRRQRLRFKDALQHLLADVEEQLTALQRTVKRLQDCRFQFALEHPLAEVEEQLIALQRAANTLSHLQFDAPLQHPLAEVREQLCALQRAANTLGHSQFDAPLKHMLLAIHDEPVTAPRRALKLPDLLGSNDGIPNKPHSPRTGSAAGDTKRHKVLKRGLSGTIDGLKVSALADTGAAQNVVSSNFARARKLDVVGSPSSFMQGNSKLAHSLGTSKDLLDNVTK